MDEHVITNEQGDYYTGEVWAGAPLFSPDKEKALKLHDQDEIQLELAAMSNVPGAKAERA